MLTVHDQLIQARMVLILCKWNPEAHQAVSTVAQQSSMCTCLTQHLVTRAEDLKQDWHFVMLYSEQKSILGGLPALSVEKSAKRLLNSVSNLLISGCTSAAFALLTAARDCTQECSQICRV